MSAARTAPAPLPGRPLLQALALLGLAMLASLAAAWFRPEREIALFGDAKLESAVPERFGDWALDTSVRPVIPDPSLLASINRIYSDTLARTYVNAAGERIMLSIAYGRRQNDTMRLHQPEGCYRGQGFGVRTLGQETIVIGGVAQGVTRLETGIGARREPVSYWMVIGGRHATTQWQAKQAQLRFGLRGYIPDGLIFRVSSINPDTRAGFGLQDRFVRDLLAAVPELHRRGLLGS